jgi:hypothetical protein
LILASPLIAWSQDALRYSLAGQQNVRDRNTALQSGDYNLRLGNAQFTADASLTAQYNDNVNLVESAPQDDVIFSPMATTRVYWPITEKNAFNFSLGLGYAAYLQHSQYSYLLIQPGSELSFDLFVKDFRFTFFDRFTYTENPLLNGAVSGVARYGGLDNSVGVNALWDLNKAILVVGYAHENFIANQQNFDYLDRASELFYARGAFLVMPQLTVGPEASSGITSYDFSFLSDSVSYSGGAFVEATLSPLLKFTARAGYVAYNFQSPDPLIAASENQSSYYFRFGVDHTINQHVSHSLTGGRQLMLGVYSDFQAVYDVRYNINWNIIRNTGLTTQFFYEHSTYPPVRVQLPGVPTISLFGDTYDRFGAALTLSYRLMQKLTASLGYQYTLKNSRTPGLDYRQNVISLGLIYHF